MLWRAPALPLGSTPNYLSLHWASFYNLSKQDIGRTCVSVVLHQASVAPGRCQMQALGPSRLSLIAVPSFCVADALLLRWPCCRFTLNEIKGINRVIAALYSQPHGIMGEKDGLLVKLGVLFLHVTVVGGPCP